MKLLTSVPWKATLLAPVNPLPLSVTEIPAVPLVGEKLARGGGSQRACQTVTWEVSSYTL